MLPLEDERHHLAQQVAILLKALPTTDVLGILLEAIDGPKQGVGLIHLVDAHTGRLFVHEVVERFGSGLHVFLKLRRLADGQCQAGHGDESVACPRLEPRISGHDVFLAFELLAELVGSVDQAVIERVARVVFFDFLVQDGLEGVASARPCGGGEDNAFARTDGHLKVAWHEEVFRLSIAAFALFGIVQTTIPVGLVVIGAFGRVELHEKVGVAFIEAHADAVFDGVVAGVGQSVFVRPLPHTAERQIGAQAERGGRVGFEQGVAHKEAVALAAEHHLLLQQDAADAIDPRGHFLPLKTLNVFVSLRAIVVADIFVQP